MTGWSEERRREHADREWAQGEASRLLALDENAWVLEPIEVYLDLKDFAAGLRPGDLPSAQWEACRALRQGSGGRLGSHSAF